MANLKHTRLENDQLAEAIHKEMSLFEENYRWLEEHMPKRFFEQLNRETIALIAHNLIGLHLQDYYSQIHLHSASIVLCLDSPDTELKVLKPYSFHGIKYYRTYASSVPFPKARNGERLRIATIYFTETVETRAQEVSEDLISELRTIVKARNPELTDPEFNTLIKSMNTRFINSLSVERLGLALDMFFRAKVRDHCQYEVRYNDNWWQIEKQHSMDIVLAWRNVPKYNFLYHIAQVVYRHGLVMQRVNATYIQPYHKDNVIILALGIHGGDGRSAWEVADISDFLRELVTVKYFDYSSGNPIVDTFVNSKLVRGNLGNLINTMITFIHQVLAQVDLNLYSYENITEALCRHPELTVKLCHIFEYKLKPDHVNLPEYHKSKEELVKLIEELDTGHEINDIRRKNVLLQGLNFVEHTLKTNFYRNNKTAYSFRLDPEYMNRVPYDREKLYPELPYSVFFIKGMYYFGFHIRFRDLARGGVRTIFPDKMERMIVERSHVFTECFNLSYTQQKKNKDIPEGGAKAVIFLEPYARLDLESKVLENEMRDSTLTQEEQHKKLGIFISEQKAEYLYQTQRSFINSLLTLINCNPDGTLKAKHVVDYWGKPEYIYLGPDELMHNNMIEWISKHSKDYEYKPGGAFITGKPSGGINHKAFGVTSLGVNVYMHEVLLFLGIDPLKDTFTVKLTGGPDGDVAGNQICNLYKYYKDTAKLLALTDGSGTIFDSKGLDLAELVKMFKEEKPISSYPPEKLNEGGFLLALHVKQDESAYSQKTLCWRKQKGKVVKDWISGNEMNSLYRSNVHQVVTDIFIPAGGRPRTLNDSNYVEYLDQDGVPTSRAIVEGANLYITSWAREKLENVGLIIIKDSSANKCGVICSSYEVLCGLALSDEEFIREKPVLVEEILEILKQRAYDEARLLLDTHQKTKRRLTEISDAISKKINNFKDELLKYLNTITLPNDPHHPMIQCYLSYCPPRLCKKYVDRLLHEIPDNHKKAIIACQVAARLVYRRGLDWSPSIIDILPLILEDSDISATG